MGKEKERGYEIVQIAIKSIELLPVFAMRDLKEADVEGLAESIRTQGLIHPILVRPKGTGWELICGHRRYLAFCKLKAPTIPAHVVDADDQKAFTLALTENLERKEPTPMEDAQAFKRAITDLKMKAEDIAKQVGRSPSWVLRRVQLLELEPRVQAAVRDGTVSSTMAEEAFLKLKHHGDQLELLKDLQDNARGGQVPTAKGLEQEANGLVKKRAKIEAMARIIQELGDKCKYPKCPKCGQPPDPDGWDMDLMHNKVQCSRCYKTWNLIKGAVRERETTLDGNVSGREKVEGGESVVKSESNDHLSSIPIQDYFDYLAENITKSEAVNIIQIGEDFDDDRMGDLTITVKVDRKKFGKLPNVLLTPPEKKGAKHSTDATLQCGGWGMNANKDILEHRKRLWGLEAAIDNTVSSAEIVHHGLERLVIDHVALSRKKELLTKEGTWTIQAVHRDYTAIVTPAPAGADRLIEEDELRALVKAAKKHGAPKKKGVK